MVGESDASDPPDPASPTATGASPAAAPGPAHDTTRSVVRATIRRLRRARNGRFVGRRSRVARWWKALSQLEEAFVIFVVGAFAARFFGLAQVLTGVAEDVDGGILLVTLVVSSVAAAAAAGFFKRGKIGGAIVAVLVWVAVVVSWPQVGD
jgi:hypothetical protein